MPSARNFFNKQEEQVIIDAIVKAELKTSGEIRVHIENFCFGNGLKRAKVIFKKLKMQNTKERNGVLFYIAARSRKVAVLGDEGIYQKLGATFWEKTVNNLINQFKENKKADALANSIIECGSQLSSFFPRSSNDADELSNTISY